jgi:cytoskeletal protein RodZ
MNQRESSGLPIRAIVMVLIFLGVVFLLVAFNSLGSADDGNSSTSTTSTSTTASPTSTASSTTAAAPAKADVRVFNVSEVPGAAEGVATKLRDQNWNVTETGNLTLEGVAATTVYYGEAPGEREAADAVGKLLQAPVAPRVPDIAEQPPGVIVVVTG